MKQFNESEKTISLFLETSQLAVILENSKFNDTLTQLNFESQTHSYRGFSVIYG